MIKIHYDFTDGTEVSYVEGLRLRDNFSTCCLDFFTTEHIADDIVVISKSGKELSRNKVLSNTGEFTLKEIRKEHNILKMLKANTFNWL